MRHRNWKNIKEEKLGDFRRWQTITWSSGIIRFSYFTELVWKGKLLTIKLIANLGTSLKAEKAFLGILLFFYPFQDDNKDGDHIETSVYNKNIKRNILAQWPACLPEKTCQVRNIDFQSGCISLYIIEECSPCSISSPEWTVTCIFNLSHFDSFIMEY